MDIKVLLDRLASPARRAILAAGWATLEEIAGKTTSQIYSLHGIGRNAVQTIQSVLKEHGLSLKDESGQG